MKLLCTIILAAALCATASAQTIRTLGYNTTNGKVVANTGTNVLTFTNDAVQITTLTNVGGGIFTGDMNYANNGISGYNGKEINFEEQIITGDWTIYGSLSWNNTTNAATTRANLGFSTNLNTLWAATNASNARSAVGLGLPALTNTSNVTTMRELAGSTNTNQPFSGSISVVGTNNTNTLVFSNGILLSQ